MKFKLDENFARRTIEIFAKEGFDVDTVSEEGLNRCSDQVIFETTKREERILITLDLDFANPLRFPPNETSGIVIIRSSRNPTLSMLETLVADFLKFWKSEEGKASRETSKLFIVEAGRIRIYQSKP